MVRDVAIDDGSGRRARRAHRRRLPAAQRDPAPGRRAPCSRSTASRRSSLDFTVMTDEERAELRERLHGDPAATAGQQPAHGHAEGRAIPFADPGPAPGACSSRRARAASGKSSVTTNLAVALAQRGHSVGVIDADVYGFSIPRMLGADRDPVVHRPDAAAARGVGRALHLDGLLRSRRPAGHLARAHAAQGARAVPHRRLLGRPRLPARRPAARHRRHLALALAVPAARPRSTSSPRRSRRPRRWRSVPAVMAEKVHLEVKGVIENMSWFTGDDGTRYELFGRGGGQALADELGVPLLGQVPLRARRCARAATTAGRSPRSTPTARRRGSSARWPSASPSSWRPARCSVRSCASADGSAVSRLDRSPICPFPTRPNWNWSHSVDVRIGVTQVARELLVELADDTDRDALGPRSTPRWAVLSTRCP